MPILFKLKIKCKSKIYVTFGNEGSNCFLINPDAKMPSLFSLPPNVLIIGNDAVFLLVSFSVFEMVISPAFTFGLVPNIKHCKMCRVEDKRSPSYFKAFEINHGKQQGSLGCQQQLMWAGQRIEDGATPLPLILRGQARTAVTALWASSPRSLGPLQVQIQLSRKQVGCETGSNKWPAGLSCLSIKIGYTGLFSPEILFF